MPSKKCGSCGETKEVSEFNKDRSKKDGLASKCRECNRQYLSKYRKDNADSLREYSRQYHKDNREAIKAQKRQYYLENIESIRENSKRYYQETADLRKAQMRRYYSENADAIKQSNRQWQRDNPDKKAAYQNKRRARKANVPSDGIPVDFRDKPCYVCGAPAEAVDHIVPLSKGGHDTVGNKAPICHSCNSAKGAHTWPGQPDWQDFLERRRNQND